VPPVRRRNDAREHWYTRVTTALRARSSSNKKTIREEFKNPRARRTTDPERAFDRQLHLARLSSRGLRQLASLRFSFPIPPLPPPELRGQPASPVNRYSWPDVPLARSRAWFLPCADPAYAIFRRELGRERHAHARRVIHSNKLATVLTTVQADICDGKLWTKEEIERERERTRGKRVRGGRGREGWPGPPGRPGRGAGLHADVSWRLFYLRIISFVRTAYSN